MIFRILTIVVLTAHVAWAEEPTLKQATKAEFKEMYSLLEKQETELRDAHQRHASHAIANKQQVSKENNIQWGRFGATWNQNLKAHKEMDDTRKKWKAEGLFSCPGILNAKTPPDKIRCAMDSYRMNLYTLWTLFNQQMSGRVPASADEFKFVEEQIKSAKTDIESNMKKMKGQK